MDLLDSLPDVATQMQREREQTLQRLGLATEYTEEQRRAHAQAYGQSLRRSNAAHNSSLVQARVEEFVTATTNQNPRANHPQMDPHPARVRLVPAQDPAGGRKKRRRRAASRRHAPQSHSNNSAQRQRFPSAPAHRTADQIAQENMQGVRNWHVENARDGTFTAYEPKKQEWDEFCGAVYGPPALLNAGIATITDLPPQIQIQLYIVSPLKCYNFVFYQAHRKPRSRRPATAVQFGPEELLAHLPVGDLTGAHHRLEVLDGLAVEELVGGAESNVGEQHVCLLLVVNLVVWI